MYVVFVSVADKAGNTLIATQKVILDRTAAAIAASLSAPNNATYYDVGTSITLTWAATDLNGVSSSSGSSEGQTISSSGGKIDVDVMTAGTHTVTISSTDKAGNVSTMTLTFTIHATPQGLINAINDGAARGWISASFKTTLITQMQQVIKGLQSSTANGVAKLRQFISYLQYPPTGGITAAYQSLMLNWSNDLLNRL
jgi:cytochrome c